ncbi:MAG TPA: HD domain-containing protein [Terracidiphilus sp.]|nr:HD domain-containing protein [Terracidiphilus sp.]
MTAPDWRTLVVEYIRREAQPPDKFGHQPRLYALATKIALAEGLAFDDDILFAAAWMHDLGVFLGHRPNDLVALARWDHVPYTVARTRELLAGWGFPAQKIDGVAAAIGAHQPNDKPKEIEAVLLRDADILEQLGVIGALRAFVKVGRDTRYQSFSSVFTMLNRLLRELPSELHLNQSKLLSGERVKSLRDFLAAIESEAGDLLF